MNAGPGLSTALLWTWVVVHLLPTNCCNKCWTWTPYCPLVDMSGSTCAAYVGGWGRGTPGGQGTGLCGAAAGPGRFTSHPPHSIASPVHTAPNPQFCSQQVVLPPLPRIRTGNTPPVSARASQGDLGMGGLGSSPVSLVPWHTRPGASWSPPRCLGGVRCFRLLAR